MASQTTWNSMQLKKRQLSKYWLKYWPGGLAAGEVGDYSEYGASSTCRTALPSLLDLQTHSRGQGMLWVLRRLTRLQKWGHEGPFPCGWLVFKGRSWNHVWYHLPLSPPFPFGYLNPLSENTRKKLKRVAASWKGNWGARRPVYTFPVNPFILSVFVQHMSVKYQKRKKNRKEKEKKKEGGGSRRRAGGEARRERQKWEEKKKRKRRKQKEGKGEVGNKNY